MPTPHPEQPRVVVIANPEVMLAYGPFPGAPEARAWFQRLMQLLDPDLHEAWLFPVSPPFDLTGEHPPEPLPEPDPSAIGELDPHVAWLADRTTGQGGVVGPFPSRAEASAWWATQQPAIHNATVRYLRVLAPYDLDELEARLTDQHPPPPTAEE